MTEAPAFSVVADVAIAKGETLASDRTRLSFPDRAARRVVVHVSHDLPHLAGVGVRRLYREWAALPVGGTLRATWPLHDSWLRLL